MRDDLEGIIQKSPRQTSVSTLGPMRSVLVEALETFDDAYTASQAYTRALHDWVRNRQANSKRGALREIKGDTGELLVRMAALEAELAEIKRVLYQRIEAARSAGCDGLEDADHV